MCAILTLGQSDHVLAIILKTVVSGFPQGKVYRVLQMLKTKNRPKDVSAEIELESELEKVQFKSANDYYNDIVAVTVRFEVNKSNTDLIKIMAKKVSSLIYAGMILNHMSANTMAILKACVMK